MHKLINKIKVLFRRINFKALQKEVQGYGFNYSLNKYIATVVILLTGMVGVSFFFKLELPYISILAIVAIFTLPIIVVAQIKTMYHLRKFEEMNNYMTHILISFKIHPKILSALKDTRDISDGALQLKIDEVIEYITGDISSTDTYENALKIIEKEYPNSRVHALHRMMLTVENENSKDYQHSSDDLFSDIESWTERTYVYQQELKMTKSKVVMSIMLALLICLMLVIGLPSNLQTFTDSPIYQTMTTLLIALSLGIYCFTQSKLNGQWLLYDMNPKKQDYILKNIDFIRDYDTEKANKSKWIKCFLFLPIVLVGVMMKNTSYMALGGIGMVVGYFQNAMTYNTKKKSIENALQMEFPLWLRDIALNLHNFVVTRAIKNSYETAPAVMKPYLEDFIHQIELDPNSIIPYQEFLSEFNIPDLTNAMRSLYSIKLLGDNDSQRQITSLITRNQKMLANAEKMRNENSLAGIGFISLAPILLASINLIINMILMVGGFFSQMNM